MNSSKPALGARAWSYEREGPFFAHASVLKINPPTLADPGPLYRELPVDSDRIFEIASDWTFLIGPAYPSPKVTMWAGRISARLGPKGQHRPGHLRRHTPIVSLVSRADTTRCTVEVHVQVLDLDHKRIPQTPRQAIHTLLPFPTH